MSVDIPLEARMEGGLDCVLLTSWPSYRSQIVRLTAIEKGCRWKHYFVDHVGPMAHLDPWYVNLNPNAYVPTMLVDGNKPVCESLDIMNYIDDKFEGNGKLNQACLDDPEIMERYKIFYDLHDIWDVEGLSMCTIVSENFVMR